MALRCACGYSFDAAARLARVSVKKIRTYERNPARVRGRRERARLRRLYDIVLPHLMRQRQADDRLAEAILGLDDPRLDDDR